MLVSSQLWKFIGKWEDRDLRTAQAKLDRPYQKNDLSKKGLGVRLKWWSVCLANGRP
jgi:hypothetical protein